MYKLTVIALLSFQLLGKDLGKEKTLEIQNAGLKVELIKEKYANVSRHLSDLKAEHDKEKSKLDDLLKDACVSVGGKSADDCTFESGDGKLLKVEKKKDK
jgi:hypothetical protein